MTKLTVLIVDDSEVDRYLLSRDLVKTHFEITLYEQQNGEDALEYLTDHVEEDRRPPEEFQPNVIFLDVNMPRMDGHEFLEEYQQLKLNHVYSKTKIIMISSSKRQEDIDRIHAYEFVSDYLIKGEYTNEMLVEKLDAVIEASSS